MRRLSYVQVTELINSIVFFLTCVGDDNNKCIDCPYRFSCYTGEVVTNKRWGEFAFEVESKHKLRLIEYDYNKHDEYHNVICIRGGNWRERYRDL